MADKTTLIEAIYTNLKILKTKEKELRKNSTQNQDIIQITDLLSDILNLIGKDILAINKEKASLKFAQLKYLVAKKHRELGSWQEAENLLEQARQTFTHHKELELLAKTLLEMGLLAHDRHDFEMAEIYLKDALRLFRRLEHTEGIAATEAAMGNLTLQTGRPTKAIELLETARQKYLGLNQENRLADIDELLQIAHTAQQHALLRQSALQGVYECPQLSA